MTDAQRAATQSLLFAILACKASLTPDLRLRAENLSTALRGETDPSMDSLRDIMRAAGLKV